MMRIITFQGIIAICFLLICLTGNTESWGQQVIGEFPSMDGGFSLQTEGNLLNTAIGPGDQMINWTVQTTSGTRNVNTTGGRSGPEYVTFGATAARRLQSPTADDKAITLATSYTIQFYYRSNAIANNGQVGVSPNGTGSPGNYIDISLPNTNGEWVKVTQSATSGNPTSPPDPRYGIGVIRFSGASGTDIDIDDFVMYAGAVDETPPNSPGTVTVDNATPTSLDVSWVAATEGVDGGGYVVVRYAVSPHADNDPNQNGIYAVGNIITNGTDNLEGTVRYIGTGTSFTDNVGLSPSTQYWYKVYTTDKAFNYSNENQGTESTIAITSPLVALIPSSLSGFNYIYGSGPSSSQSFSVSGSNLEGNIEITASTNYEISLTQGNGYTDVLNLIPTAGIVAATTVYIRLKDGLTPGNYNNEITSITSPNAASENLTCNGYVLPLVVISQVYGGGGNSGAPYTHDYVELFNRGDVPVSLNGLSVQYAGASATGNFGASAAFLTELPDVTLQPGKYYLIQQAGGTNGVPLPTPDLIDLNPINLAAGAGKLVLVTGITSLGCNGDTTPCSPEQLSRIIDLVGYGNANFYEGSGAAPTLSNTTAAIRNNNGCTDTDDNAADFTAGTPVPRNTASPVNICLVIVDPTITVNKTELIGFTYEFGSGPSASQTFDVSGVKLTNNVILNAPTHYEISLSPGSEYNSTLSLTPSSGTLTNTPIYVRLKSGFAIGDYNDEDITINSTGAIETTVTCSGSVTPEIEVVISQVYGGGGNSGADYTHDFIELYNRGTSSVDITGWSVQYTSAAGTSWSTTSIPAFSLSPGQYYLIQQAAGAGGTTSLPTPDVIGTVNIAATNGKVALVSNTTALTGACSTGSQIINFVGYGSANCFEGSGAAPALSNTTAAIRNNNGCTDTDDNADDFLAVTPNPRNSSNFYNCSWPQVATPEFSPVAGLLVTPQNVEISSATVGATIYYTTDGSEPTQSSTQYTGPLLVSPTTTIRAKAYMTDMNPSEIGSASFSVPIDVANIAALRAGATDGTYYRLTGEAIVTLVGIISSGNHRHIYIQDGTGAILIHDAGSNTINTTAFVPGDGIQNIIGTLGLNNQMLQFLPYADPGKSSQGNPLTPAVKTLNQITPGNNQAELVTVYACSFAAAGTGNFQNFTSYLISDATAKNFTLRTQYNDLDIIGEPIPEGSHITGVLLQFQNTMQIVPVNQGGVITKPGLFTTTTNFVMSPLAIEVLFGTLYADAIAQLPTKTTLTDSEGKVYEVDIINWVIEDYNPQQPGVYLARGEIVLPPWISNGSLAKSSGIFVETVVTVLNPPIPLPISSWALYIAMAAIIIAAVFFMRRKLVRS